MKRLFLSVFLILTLGLSGCAGFTNFNMSNQAQQLVIKTSIQLATATYLDKNSSPDSVNLVITVTEDIMSHLTSDDIYNSTMLGLQKELHEYIAEQNLTIAEKIALTSLADVVISEAVSWATISLDVELNETHVSVLFFCANTMHETAKLFLLPEVENRGYSVTRKY